MRKVDLGVQTGGDARVLNHVFTVVPRQGTYPRGMGFEPRHDLATPRIGRTVRDVAQDTVAGLALGQRDKRGTAAACCLRRYRPQMFAGGETGGLCVVQPPVTQPFTPLAVPLSRGFWQRRCRYNKSPS